MLHCTVSVVTAWCSVSCLVVVALQCCSTANTSFCLVVYRLPTLVVGWPILLCFGLLSLCSPSLNTSCSALYICAYVSLSLHLCMLCISSINPSMTWCLHQTGSGVCIPLLLQISSVIRHCRSKCRRHAPASSEYQQTDA